MQEGPTCVVASHKYVHTARVRMAELLCPGLCQDNSVRQCSHPGWAAVRAGVLPSCGGSPAGCRCCRTRGRLRRRRRPLPRPTAASAGWRETAWPGAQRPAFRAAASPPAPQAAPPRLGAVVITEAVIRFGCRSDNGLFQAQCGSGAWTTACDSHLGTLEMQTLCMSSTP